MTEEERRKLCARLRRLDLERDVGIKAADEIERLERLCRTQEQQIQILKYQLEGPVMLEVESN